MIHTVVFRLIEPIRIAALLQPNIRVQRLRRSGSEPGTPFEVVGHPSFILFARHNINTDMASPVCKIQLALSDHYQTYNAFLEAIETVFAPGAFSLGNPQLVRIDYALDLPLRIEHAVLGATYAPARGYAYGKGAFSTPRQIVIGVNPCLAIYDRGRRLARLAQRQSSQHRVGHVPEGNLSRFEVRYKREVQNGAQVFPLELEDVCYPDQLMEHARAIFNGLFSPFAGVQYYDTNAFRLPEAPRVTGYDVNWDDPAFRQQVRDYVFSIEVLARIKGMMEVANLHLVRGYCRPYRGVRGVFAPVERNLATPFDLTELFRREVGAYFQLIRPRPRMRPD